jgi:hypothetical protein
MRLTTSHIVSGHRIGAYPSTPIVVSCNNYISSIGVINQENISTFVGFFPYTIFVVAKNLYMGFSMEGVHHFTFLMERMHIVGIACGTPLAQSTQYLTREIFAYVPSDLMPDFSSQKQAIQVLQLG